MKCVPGRLYKTASPLNITIVNKVENEWSWVGFIPISRNEPVLMLEEMGDFSYGIFLYGDRFCIIQYSSVNELIPDERL